MIFNKQNCKLLIEKGFTAEMINQLDSSFNVENFKYVEAMASGFIIELSGFFLADLAFSEEHTAYKILHKPHTVNNIKVAAPMREMPNTGDCYYFIEDRSIASSEWTDHRIDILRFESNNCFFHENDAEANRRAMFKLGGKG